jgi:hypothetical protein
MLTFFRTLVCISLTSFASTSAWIKAKARVSRSFFNTERRNTIKGKETKEKSAEERGRK